MEMKTCSICGLSKLITSFGKDKRQKQGRRPECKKCEHSRPSILIKRMKWRVLNNKNYIGLRVEITGQYLSNLSDLCYFCGNPIEESSVIHRLNNSIGYVMGNIKKAHQSCHARFHSDCRLRNNKGQFTARKVG